MVFEKIAEILEEQRDITGIKPESAFSEIGLDSLDMVDLIMTIEEAFGVTIEMDDSIATVGDLVKKIEKLMS